MGIQIGRMLWSYEWATGRTSVGGCNGTSFLPYVLSPLGLRGWGVAVISAGISFCGSVSFLFVQSVLRTFSV
jgi:hypothetical protein